MWYIYGSEWKKFDPKSAPDRIYKIAHATSFDGLIWSKEEGVQIIEDRLGPNECQALPSVIEIDGIFHMFFCFNKFVLILKPPLKKYKCLQKHFVFF